MCKLCLRLTFILMLAFFSLNSFAQNDLLSLNSKIPILETGNGPMPNEWIDNRTGHKIVKLTRRPGNNISFYFHNNPFIIDPITKASKMIFFGLDRSLRNAYTVNLKNFAIEQVTFAEKGITGEIVGKKYQNLYYQYNDSVFVANLITKKSKLLFVFPANYKGYIATVNADETMLAGSKASDAQIAIGKKYPEKKDFFDRIFDAHEPNDLFTINIKTGKLEVIHTEPTWLGHVQFSPTQPNLLMFCHEGPWHKLDRIWHININTKQVKLMHKRTMDMEIAGHEWFAPDGKTIWFDLQQPKGETFFVAGTHVETGKEVKYRLKRDEWSIHFNISDDMKQFCGDGGDPGQVARAKDGQWIYHFKPSGDSLQSERLVNMQHQNYRLEPNVHFSPDGKWIIFRANFEGTDNVYAVEIKKDPQFKITQWPLVNKEAKPWTRWWWMGSAVDKEGIDQQLTTLNKAGFGGAAIVPIYGAIGYEEKYIKYLSPAWMQSLDYTTQKATKLHMGIDISVGTGWPIGGPQVKLEEAATNLIVQHYRINESQPFNDKILHKDKKQAIVPGSYLSSVMAYDTIGNVLDITNKVGVDGQLIWPDVKGNWDIYAAFIGKTGQKVKRAAYGGEGWVLDHFSANAVTNYFKTFDTAFGNSNHGVRSFYNDSYEVFEADWTPNFFQDFKLLRGYDLKPYLKYLVSNVADSITTKIKCDYRETINDLLLQNFAHQFTKWANDKRSKNTNESHGSPGNILDLYAAVDIPETETFGSSKFDIPGIRRDAADVRNVDPDPIMLKFASSAAHVMGKPFVSSETFTWLTEHFKTSWSQCKPELEQTFLAGVNHVFYHGTTYTPPNVAWPGWLFYASVNFVPTNSLWPHITGLNEYVTRCQSILQAGNADNEILAYWPVYDQWSNAKGLDMTFKVHNVDEWLHPTDFYKNVNSLQTRGYSIDFVSDKMLSEAIVKNNEIKITEKGAKYKVLLVSKSKYMPIATFKNLIALASKGMTVILQDFPSQLPGIQLQENANQQLSELIKGLTFTTINNDVKESIVGTGRIVIANNVEKGLEYINLKRETLTDLGLKFIRRDVNGDKFYYIVNHTTKTINQDIALNVTCNSVLILNPLNGETGVAKFTKQGNTTMVKIQLQPGETLFVKASLNSDNDKPYPYFTNSSSPILLNDQWNLHFSNGGPFIPSTKKLDKLQPWTNLTNDSTTQSFSGTGIYTTHYTIKTKNADDYILVLDKLYESAKVTVNGKEAGYIWSIPYQLNIGKFLKEGDNIIDIEVANLMANRIAYMDRNNMEWRKYHEINFVNINYKGFDASKWSIQPSGLDGNIVIKPVYYIK